MNENTGQRQDADKKRPAPAKEPLLEIRVECLFSPCTWTSWAREDDFEELIRQFTDHIELYHESTRRAAREMAAYLVQRAIRAAEAARATAGPRTGDAMSTAPSKYAAINAFVKEMQTINLYGVEAMELHQLIDARTNNGPAPASAPAGGSDDYAAKRGGEPAHAPTEAERTDLGRPFDREARLEMVEKKLAALEQRPKLQIDGIYADLQAFDGLWKEHRDLFGKVHEQLGNLEKRLARVERVTSLDERKET